ncbi:MAG TPA: acid phosphatase [Usitatibacter sp.]|jgi:acid phosphatase|nr:acid phosphatase [Usitatibacter sp.]
MRRHIPVLAAALLGILLSGCGGSGETLDDKLQNKVQHIVVIYGENRSFDNLYGNFPGANGLANAQATMTQADRDGSVLAMLPPTWGGMTANVPQAATVNLPNKAFRVDDPSGFNQPITVTTRDLVHRFYNEQMQIDGGKMDRFAAWTDAGGLTMGTYNGSNMAMYKLAQQYALADNFFIGAFGGSFLNHFWLICACTPVYPNAASSVAASRISAVEADGVTLKVAPDSPASALQGPPKFVNDNTLTPDGFAVNTMQPPYEPSGNAPASGGNAALADPANSTTLPPQALKTIGDTLTAKGVTWAWYAGAWSQASSDRSVIYNNTVPNFQAHHQPFNYFARFAPGTADRTTYLKDYTDLTAAIDAGTLPAVSFYKPQGNLNQHPGYADVADGDQHIADVVNRIKASKLWDSTVIIVTYDENGGFWDHVSPPKGDRWGPGQRVPTIVIAPFAKMGYVDHTQYDTTSILAFITRRFGLDPLPGVRTNMGDLTNTLDF